MCGIAGIAGTVSADRTQRVAQMCASLVHRGPDAEGEHGDDLTRLGVRRLRVVDLDTGDQPQSNEDGSVWTVFNGEIYNFRELRADLAARGHRFRTDHSDTEVIPHLYEELGPAFPARLHGMFAIALWDARARRLVLARDRLGKKPLLYHETAGEIAFASEHAALLASGKVMRRASPEAIRAYLRLGYVPDPDDAFEGVRKLRPGHVLVWREGASTIQRYWELRWQGVRAMSERDAVELVRAGVSSSVRRRLVADVPVGAFLSGGLDSSAVVATMAELSGRVRTFTAGFADQRFSELGAARRVAEHFGTEHHEFLVDPADVSVLSTLVRHYGEPYADSSALPTYHLARVTRRHVTVALNGDGGDEAFAGYDRYLAARVAAAFDVAPLRLARALAAAAGRSLPRGAGAAARARRLLEPIVMPPGERYLQWVGVFRSVDLARLLSPDFAAATAAADHAIVAHAESIFRTFDPLTAAQIWDLNEYLPGDLLAKVDIASMANSLEVRSPLLDHELIELLATIPPHLKARGLEQKRLLRRAMTGILPEDTLRRAKHGFGVPVAAWIRGPMREHVASVLLSRSAQQRGYFAPGQVASMVDEHLSERADHAQRLWALLMLEEWHRAFIDGAEVLAA